MRQLQMKYRVYSLDMYGFGDSGKNPQKYAVPTQVALLSEFMKKLDIAKAAMIGHGLGAQVMAYFAHEEPARVARLMVTGAPLFDPGDITTRVAPEFDEAPVVEEEAPEEEADAAPETPEALKPAQQPLASKVRVDGAADASNFDQTIPSASRGTVSNPRMIDRDILRKAREAAMARDTRVIERVQVVDEADEESEELDLTTTATALAFGGWEPVEGYAARNTRGHPEPVFSQVGPGL